MGYVQTITHEKVLADCDAEFRELLDTMSFQAMNLYFSGLQVHAAEQVLEARVRAQRIVDWIHFNGC